MRLSLPLFLVLAIFAGFSDSALNAGKTTQPPQGEVEMNVLTFSLMETVRETDRVVPMQIQAYNSGIGAATLVRLDAFGVDGGLLDSINLQSERLLGDEGELFRIHRMLELMDPELTHRHTDRLFIPLEDWQPLSPEEEGRLLSETIEAVDQLKRSGAMQAKNITFQVDLAEVFADGSLPGDQAVYDLRLHYLDASRVAQVVETTHAIQLLAPYLPPPAEWYDRLGLSRGSATWHAGDLHVHNCRDQASLGCPDCNAESFNLTGSFTNADLKPQFQALGMTWFSTTTHSYCVNNDAEFNAIVAESNQLDDANFRLLCGTELTILETGPQTGSDINDSVCFLNGHWNRGIAHMGGHGITSRKPGGQQGFLDNCDGPIFDQAVNVSATNAEGGFTIANHPGGDVISFNSVARFHGMEARQTVGTEVWNHDVSNRFMSTQHRKWWLDRMFEGKITYPFSGSDTHDEAVDFGATHVLLQGALSDQALISAMKQGRHYMSNGPFASNTLYDNRGRSLDMGGIAQVAAAVVPNNYPVHLDSFYNLGTDVGTMRVYRGVVGDSAETLLAEYLNITGSGVMTTDDTVQQAGTSWYRTEIEIPNVGAAYTSLCIIYLY
jgi:hypothetical protein